MTIYSILLQHCEAISALFIQRNYMCTNPQVSLEKLGRIDERLQGNIEGILIAGKSGWNICLEQIEDSDTSSIFCAGIIAINTKNETGLTNLLSLSEALATEIFGLSSSLEWVGESHQAERLNAMLVSDQRIQTIIGTAASTLLRVNLGDFLEGALNSEDIEFCAIALESAGILGRSDLLLKCQNRSSHETKIIKFQASYSATLLGSQNCLKQLGEFAIQPGPYQHKALNLLLKAIPLPTVHRFIQSLSKSRRKISKAAPTMIRMIPMLNWMRMTIYPGRTWKKSLTGGGSTASSLKRAPVILWASP